MNLRLTSLIEKNYCVFSFHKKISLPDIIHLLPDNIANQIAAGEVIQRPASAVKELLENAVDADATEIKLFITDAGKTLIQVIDNGKGMSETDARLSFERHATSKIKNIDDLFNVRTMGFRGEALASIAAVSQVEIKTRKADEELGTFLEIENSFVLKQEQCSCAIGTNICMKNLFFNVPARRNFLKSNAAEMRHIIDEFIRVAMAFPQIFFSLTSNGQEVFHLESGNHKQRVLQILGNQYSSKLVTINEETDYMNIYGFVGKPDAAKKTRGDQYFFVNNRFIKSAYLNHAVMSAFNEMIAKDAFPMYVLYIDLDPSQVDINVHPTKQEIKFEDEKIMYAFVQAAIKHALAQFSISPSLDFSLNPAIQQLDAVSKPFTEEKQESISSSTLFKTFTQKNQSHFIEHNESDLKNWEPLFDKKISQEVESLQTQDEIKIQTSLYAKPQNLIYQPRTDTSLIQIHCTYIVAETNNGFMLVHQQLAHERILYEKLCEALNGKQIAAQQSLFPATINLSNADAAMLTELLPELNAFGYLIESFGKDSFIIQGTPADILHGNEKNAIELLIEQFKHFSNEIKYSRREKLLRCMSRQQAIKAGQTLQQKEMQILIEELFQCKTPNVTANGSPTYLEFKEDYLVKMFAK